MKKKKKEKEKVNKQKKKLKKQKKKLKQKKTTSKIKHRCLSTMYRGSPHHNFSNA